MSDINIRHNNMKSTMRQEIKKSISILGIYVSHEDNTLKTYMN